MTLSFWDVTVVSLVVTGVGVGVDVALHFGELWWDYIVANRRRKEWVRGEKRNQ